MKLHSQVAFAPSNPKRFLTSYFEELEEVYAKCVCWEVILVSAFSFNDRAELTIKKGKGKNRDNFRFYPT